MLRKLNSIATLIGFYPNVLYSNIKGIVPFVSDYLKIKKQINIFKITDFPINRLYPCLRDRFDESGIAHGHYFHQDLLVAQMIYANNPQKHVDIGSSVNGFVSHVASFRMIELMDIRPLENRTKNIVFKQMDLMIDYPDLHEYCDSISSLHAIEHFGLGRYGDPVNVNGHLVALENIYKILKVGGKFYFSVPIGEQRIEFHAHRVFSLQYLLNIFGIKYRIDSFSYVNDAGNLIENATINEETIMTNFNCNYGCGIFELTKL